MEEYEIEKETVPLLSGKGRLRRPGWAPYDRYRYNKSKIKQPLRCREWEVYHLFSSDFALRVEYGHGGGIGLARVVFSDFASGETLVLGKPVLFCGDAFDLDFSPEQDHAVKSEQEDVFFTITREDGQRRIRIRTDRLQADLKAGDSGDAVAAAIPLNERKAFYYNYKRVFHEWSGSLTVDGKEHLPAEKGIFHMASGRGVWPWRQNWVWACGGAELYGQPLFFNLGWDYAPPGTPTENAMFLSGSICKLAKASARFSREKLMQPWHISDSDRFVHLNFTPQHMVEQKINRLLWRRKTVFLYGTVSGSVFLPGSKKLPLENMPFFVEYAENFW